MMGVKLLGKIKIYDIAKKLDLTSKEILEVAKRLNIEAKSHLSGVEESDAQKIEKELSKKSNKKEGKGTANKGKMETKKEEKAPVIIRREVIINEEEQQTKKKEEAKKETKKENVGFVERKQNKDFNIVYRNKQSKPMTVSELFGLNKPEPKKAEVKKEEPVSEPKKEEKAIEKPVQKETEKPAEKVTEKVAEKEVTKKVVVVEESKAQEQRPVRERTEHRDNNYQKRPENNNRNNHKNNGYNNNRNNNQSNNRFGNSNNGGNNKFNNNILNYENEKQNKIINNINKTIIPINIHFKYDGIFFISSTKLSIPPLLPPLGLPSVPLLSSSPSPPLGLGFTSVLKLYVSVSSTSCPLYFKYTLPLYSFFTFKEIW